MIRRQCPRCPKAFTMGGLCGHLRFVHGLNPRQAHTASIRAKKMPPEPEIFDVASPSRRKVASTLRKLARQLLLTR